MDTVIQNIIFDKEDIDNLRLTCKDIKKMCSDTQYIYLRTPTCHVNSSILNIYPKLKSILYKDNDEPVMLIGSKNMFGLFMNRFSTLRWVLPCDQTYLPRDIEDVKIVLSLIISEIIKKKELTDIILYTISSNIMLFGFIRGYFYYRGIGFGIVTSDLNKYILAKLPIIYPYIKNIGIDTICFLAQDSTFNDNNFRILNLDKVIVPTNSMHLFYYTSVCERIRKVGAKLPLIEIQVGEFFYLKSMIQLFIQESCGNIQFCFSDELLPDVQKIFDKFREDNILNGGKYTVTVLTRISRIVYDI
jgi:hypothetical protein